METCIHDSIGEMVREMGLEPTRRNHTHLKRACLPFQHSRKCTHILYDGGSVLSILFSFRVGISEIVLYLNL